MAKQHVTIYLSVLNSKWLEVFPPADTKSGSVAFVSEWGVSQLRRGAVTAFQALVPEEREAIIQSVSELGLDVRIANIADRTREWLTLDGGQMLEWPEEKIRALVEKLKSFSPTQTMGLLCWARGYYEKEGASLSEYANDLAGLLQP